MCAWMFPTYPWNWMKKIHHQLYSIKYYVKLQKNDFKNSPKMNLCFFETEIWYAWLALGKNWMTIIQDEQSQFYSILYTNL